MMTRAQLLDKIYGGVGREAQADNQKKREGHTGRVTARFWPTEASALTPLGPVGRCRRRTYYSQQGVTSLPEELPTLGKYHMGHKIEEWIRDLSRGAGIYLDNNVKIQYYSPIKGDIIISGEVDLLYKINDEKVGGEIKSSYGYKFNNYVFHKPTVPGMPKVEHTLQVMLYLYYYTIIDKSLGIRRFVITYVDRGSMEWIQHCVEMTDDLEPIVNGIVMKNIHNYKNGIYDVPKMNAQKVHDKLSKYEFTLHNVFARFKEIFDHHESGLLVPKDYNPLYSDAEVEDKRSTGAISKSKYDNYKNGRVAYMCDDECGYCDFREHCMKEDGMI